MTAPLTHATEYAIADLLGDKGEHRFLVSACGVGVLSPESALSAGSLYSNIPTCPKCAVLRDAALEGREVAP